MISLPCEFSNTIISPRLCLQQCDVTRPFFGFARLHQDRAKVKPRKLRCSPGESWERAPLHGRAARTKLVDVKNCALPTGARRGASPTPNAISSSTQISPISGASCTRLARLRFAGRRGACRRGGTRISWIAPARRDGRGATLPRLRRLHRLRGRTHRRRRRRRRPSTARSTTR